MAVVGDVEVCRSVVPTVVAVVELCVVLRQTHAYTNDR